MSRRGLWFINQYASTPDQPSTSAFYLGRELQAHDFDVTFFSAAQNYYFQERTKGRKWRPWSDEKCDGVTFRWLSTSRISSAPVGRMFNLLSFAAVALLAGLSRRPRPEVVVGTCPHPFAGLTAWILAKCFGAKFVYEIRDIWPESLEEYGTGPVWAVVIRFFRTIQTFLYNRADLVISVLPGIDQYFNDVGRPDQETVYLPNCIPLQSSSQPSHTSDIFGTAKVFRFVYCGGFSRYQGLDTLVRAACLLQERADSDFELHMVGAGSEKAELSRLVGEFGATHVFLHDPIPRSEVHSVLQSGDCNIFHLNDIGFALHYGVSPNKLVEYLHSGKPLVYALPFDWDLLTESGIGASATCGSADSLADAMHSIMNAPHAALFEMGRNARVLANEFDVRTVAKRFADSVA